MEIPEAYSLSIDIISVFQGRVYGRAGDKVKIIACHDGKVAAVENESGNRFACRMEYLTKETVVLEPKQPEVKPDPVPSRNKYKNIKPTTTNQTQLF